MKRVYGHGTKICGYCKGVCHKDSYREKYGDVKAYYCSRNCLESVIIKVIEDRIPLEYREGKEREGYIHQPTLDYVVEKYNEKVDVI